MMFIIDSSVTLELDFQLMPRTGEFCTQCSTTFTECTGQG